MEALVRLEQLEKALSPISVTDGGMVMLVRLEQPQKAHSPISVTDGGMEMLVRLEQPEKAYSPNLRHRFWNADAREAGATRESIFPNLRHRWGDDSILTPTYQSIALRMDYGIAVLS